MTLWTAREVSEHSRVSLKTLYRWAAEWDQRPIGPKPIRLGPRQLRYEDDDVRTWLAGGYPAGKWAQ